MKENGKPKKKKKFAKRWQELPQPPSQWGTEGLFPQPAQNSRVRCLPGEEAIALAFKMKSCITQSVLKRSKITKFCNFIRMEIKAGGWYAHVDCVVSVSPWKKSTTYTDMLIPQIFVEHTLHGHY